MSTRKRPAAPKPAIYIKTDVSPETLFQAIGRLRKEAADEIDRLLTFLDSLEDTDVDLGIDDEPHDQTGEDDEDGVDSEPSLGWTDSGGGVLCTGHFDLDAEGEEHDGSEPDVDDEPSLGSSNDYHGKGTDYDHIAPANITDAEGPDYDFEPSLCGVGSHVVGGFGNDRDLEATTI
ncbi:hypothetical protein V1282_000907 [Nitrobacteraceae bacterium AZCC 2146]